MCLITSYHLNLNSSDYRDSCYVTWLGASFCVLGKYRNQGLLIWRLLYNGLPIVWHSSCLYSLRNSNVSGTLWLSKSLYQTLFKSNLQMAYLNIAIDDVPLLTIWVLWIGIRTVGVLLMASGHPFFKQYGVRARFPDFSALVWLPDRCFITQGLRDDAVIEYCVNRVLGTHFIQNHLMKNNIKKIDIQLVSTTKTRCHEIINKWNYDDI